MLWGILALIATDILGLIPPWLIKDAIDAIPTSGTHWELIPYTLALICVVVLMGFFRFLWRNHLFGLSRKVEYHLRNDLFRHLQGLPLGFFQKMKTGDLMSRATNDMIAIQELIGFAGLLIVDSALTLLTCMVLMAIIDLKLTLLTMIPLPILSISFLKFGKLVRKKALEVQGTLADMSDHVQETISGIRVVHAYVQEEERRMRFHELSHVYATKNIQLARIRGLFYALLGLGAGLAAAIVLWQGGRLVLGGQITLGEFVAFNSYLSMLTWPMMALGFIYNLFQRGAASMDRLDEVLEERSSISDPPHPVFLQEFVGGIELKKVDFSYSDDAGFVLKDISFSVSKGEKLAIMGPVGCGKSTLLKLLPRIYDVSGGAFLIDGKDIRDIPIEQLRKSIGFVEQEPFLFSDTIQKNITFGSDSQDSEAVKRTVEIVRLDKDLQSLPNGLMTLIGERGITLSGGQKQRIVIARAILRTPPILVLDDAFSHLDTETEEEILTRLFEEMADTTIIFATHRATTAQRADKIVIIEDGMISEEGTHWDLMAGKGLYSRIYQRQMIAREIENGF